MARVFEKGTHPVWAAFASMYLLSSIGLVVYWMVGESGPIGWLIDVQRPMFDGWYPKMTALVVFLLLFLPLLAIKIVIERLTGRSLTGR
jgi:hypothetical protein